jgi:hypothetical protein
MRLGTAGISAPSKSLPYTLGDSLSTVGTTGWMVTPHTATLWLRWPSGLSPDGGPGPTAATDEAMSA